MTERTEGSEAAPPRSAAGAGPERPTTVEQFFEQLDVVDALRELVALGGRLDVTTLVAAYRAGCFPWLASGPHAAELEEEARHLARTGDVPVLPDSNVAAPLVPWLSPEPRPVLGPDAVHIPRSLRRQLRSCGWTTTADAAFEAVIAGCAGREGSWVTGAMAQAYSDLHRAGVAHSVEAWSGDVLVGGLYGVLVGRVFCGESMFHLVSGASKVAVVDLCHRLTAAGVVLIDTEERSDHMVQLGQGLMEREDYVALVRRLRDDRVTLPTSRAPVDRLVNRRAEQSS